MSVLVGRDQACLERIQTGACRKFIVITLGILAVAVRLLLINQPFIDRWSWRQSDVAAIARNFSENGFHFGHPQIDWAGDAHGYVGTEFPILPFLAAIIYKVAGIHEWIGRSEAIILFAVSLPFFFLLVRDTWHGLPGHDSSAECRCHVAAIWATFFYAFAPLNIFAGRSFMPDVPSLSLAIIGLYFFLRWTEHRALLCAPSGFETRCTNTEQDVRWMHRLQAYVPFFASVFAISLSILIKVTTIVIAAPLAYLAVAALYDRRGNKERRFPKPPGRSGDRPSLNFSAHRAPLQLIAFAAITILPSTVWYWHAYQIAERFYPHHFFGEGGVRIENFAWYWDIAQLTATSSLTPVLSMMAIIGVLVTPRGKYRWLFHWWLGAMILFIILAGYGNRHPWYQLPLVPIAAGFAGAACAFIASRISSRIVAITLSILVAGSFLLLAYLYVRHFYWSSAAVQLRDAGLELKKSTAPDSLIIAADIGDPTIFYYAERRGWNFLEKGGIYNGNPSDSRQLIVDLEQLRSRGATHLVFIASTFWWLDYYPEFTQHLTESATLMKASPEFRIYRLTPIRE